jgi:hypothetical protein
MRRFLLIGFACLVLIVVLAAGGIYWFLSGDGIRIALERQATAWLGQPVRVSSARVEFLPRIAIRLDGVSVGEPARVLLTEVAVSTALRALLARRIADAEVRIRDSRLELPLPFALPSKAAPEQESADGAAPAVVVESIRSIALQDVTVASRGREIRVSADSSLAGTSVQLRELTAESGKTSISARGAIELEPRVDATLEVTANRIDLDELLALADAFSGSVPSRALAAGQGSSEQQTRIVAHVTANTGTIGGVDVSQVVGEFQIEGDQVVLSPLAFQVFGGRFEGSFSATLQDSMAVTIRSRLVGLDVAALAAFGGAADTISGTLSGEGHFTGSGGDFAAVLGGARGSGTAAIVDGTIQRLGLVRTVVLFFGRPAADAAAATDAFSRMDLEFSLARQLFSADAFSLRSADADISGTGTLAVSTKALNGRLDLMLSQDLSAQAGTDLLRYTREGDRVVLPAALGGTLERPRLTIDAAAALRRGLRNEIGGRLKGLLGR